jgi:hypothetical protein
MTGRMFKLTTTVPLERHIHEPCAVISDDGREIRLTTYAGAQAAAEVVLPPLRAIALAGELIEAAKQHLTRAAEPGRRRRGGDPKAAARRERNADFRALAQLLAPGEPFEEQARIVIDRVRRYQPAPGETGEARRRMARIKAIGLTIPGINRMTRILSAETGTEPDAGANSVPPAH